MDFDVPADLASYLEELDEFIEREIRPLEQQDDNIRFFDYRREDARTDWDRGGLPSREWELLLAEARRRADEAGHYRYAFPKKYGGRDGTNLGMAIIREHLAGQGLGLHCDLQNEHMIVGNNVGLLLMLEYGTAGQQAEWVDRLAAGRGGFAFGITEPAHGSDATFMETSA
ncbi:MAG TPA: acyl-CoA dehydrogenase family protein, partial [Streptosporangiaceae bacterium]|nr:acyl-CoA dehydrogenase family protein [Streptosporangiaceae bacterium]